MPIRPATPADADALWDILRPTLRAGETYALPRDLSRDAALAYWLSPANEVFVFETDDHQILGTYFLRPNQQGGGSHVANCGYITSPTATGRGVARAMCQHSLDHARHRGYRAIQFNFIVSTNTRAVSLWHRLGFTTVGRLPAAFLHPTQGYVDALIMFRPL